MDDLVHTFVKFEKIIINRQLITDKTFYCQNLDLQNGYFYFKLSGKIFNFEPLSQKKTQKMYKILFNIRSYQKKKLNYIE